MADALVDDFEMGEVFRQMIIPRAVLYFTEEIDEDDDDFSINGDSDDDDDAGDSDNSIEVCNTSENGFS